MLIEPLDNFQADNFGFCLRCAKEYPYKSNKKFCSSNCRKRYSEGKVNSRLSPRKRVENMMLLERAQRLGECYYQTKCPERWGFLKELIDLARSGQDNHLRLILSNLSLLKANRHDPSYFFINGKYHNGNIAKIANAYCRRLWSAGVKDVVYNKVEEPGEVT